MVTHDERLLPVCDRVLVMHDGVLTERTKPVDEADEKEPARVTGPGESA